MSKYLTFGELMLRLKSPGKERFLQSPSLEATFGGGEANVAVSLANYGLDAEFLSVVLCFEAFHQNSRNKKSLILYLVIYMCC